MFNAKLIFFELLVVIINIVKQYTQDIQINNSSDSITSSLKEIINKYQLNQIGSQVIAKEDPYTNELNADGYMAFQFINFNSEIGLDGHQITSVFHNKEEVISGLYEINYYYPNSLIRSNKHFIQNISLPFVNDDVFFKCNYTFLNVNFTEKIKEINNQYTKTVQYGRYSFGISNLTLYNIYDYDKKDFKSYIFNSQNVGYSHLINGSYKKSFEFPQRDSSYLENIINVFISIDIKDNTGYIIAFLNTNKVHVYKIIVTILSLTMRNVPVLVEISNGDFSSSYVIYDAKIDNNQLYISSTKAKGIEVYEIKKNEINYQYNIDDGDLEYQAFIINSNTLYGLSKSTGLIILDKSSNASVKKINSLSHLNILEIYSYSNPFTGSKFVGVFFDHSQTKSEFYMELLIYNEKSPTINKIFTSTKPNSTISSIVILDTFFIYFYDKKQNIIYSTRRGVFNKVPIITYTFNLNNSEYKNEKFLPFYNFTTSDLSYMLTNGTSALIISSIKYENQILNCTFNKLGKYMVVFERIADSCYQVMGKQGEICKKGYFYQLTSFGEYSNDIPKTVAILLCCIIIIIGIIIILTFWKYYHELLSNRLKLIKINKNDRKALYLDSKDEFEQLQPVDSNKKRKEKPFDRERGGSTKTFNLKGNSSEKNCLAREISDRSNNTNMNKDVFVYQVSNNSNK